MKTTNTTRRGRRAAGNQKPNAVSSATMGKALAILATSCAAFQSSPTPCRVGMVSTGPLRSPVALQYRYGNETDQMPIRMQAERSEAVEKTRQTFSLSHFTLFSRTPGKDDQQVVMDEYLEYVDRRYSRIHEDSASVSTSRRRRPKVILDFQVPRKIFFSTLALHQRRGQNDVTDNPVKTMAASSMHELNALGLTDLASARLQKRLQAPRDLRDEFTAASYLLEYLPSPSFEAALATHIEKVSSPAPAPVVTSSSTAVAEPTVGGRVSSFSGVGPVVQFQLMVQTLRKFFQAFATTMKIMGNFASRAIPEILEKGGFRNSVRMFSAATLALLFMFKPLFKGAMKS